jgi:phenylpropionate dioxygenase-like ring-hydroxylating dioxygenase large terminal subunit
MSQMVKESMPSTYGHKREMQRRQLDRIGVEQYISEDFYQKELKTIWRKCWLWAGRASEIPNPGDYFVLNLPFLDRISILVIRGKDDKVRAFYNVCQHRGGRLAYYERGNAGVLRCTFHGWTYNLDGRLAGVTFGETFCDLDRSQRGLKPISVDTWGGWVFVNLNPAPRWTLREYLSPLPDALGAYLEKEPWAWEWGRKGLFKCNWKLQVDSQAEGYHARFLHARSIIAKFTKEDTPTWTYPESVGVPFKLEVHRPQAQDSGVFLSELAKAVGTYSTALYYNTDTDDYKDGVASRYPGAVNVFNGDRWTFDLYGIFPNTVILVQKGHLMIMRSWPRGVGQTLWDYDEYFTRPPVKFGEYLARLHGLLEMRNTVTEDMTTVEGLQDSFTSSALKEQIIGEAEIGVGAFERHLLRMVDELSD